MPSRPTARTSKRILSPARDVFRLAGAAGPAILTVGKQVEFAVLARRAIDVGVAPRIQRHVLLQVGSAPLGIVADVGAQRLQSFVGRGITPEIEAILIQRLRQRLDLRLRDRYFGLSDLTEIARGHV